MEEEELTPFEHAFFTFREMQRRVAQYEKDYQYHSKEAERLSERVLKSMKERDESYSKLQQFLTADALKQFTENK